MPKRHRATRRGSQGKNNECSMNAFPTDESDWSPWGVKIYDNNVGTRHFVRKNLLRRKNL